MYATLQMIADEQPLNFSIYQFDFVRDLERAEATAEIAKAKVTVDNAMEEVFKSFSTLLADDESNFKQFLHRLTAEEDGLVADQHNLNVKHKNLGMEAAQSVMDASYTWETGLKGIEGLRAYNSKFCDVQREMLQKGTNNAPAIVSIIDCNTMVDQLEVCISNTASILHLHKEFSVALVLLPWDDSRSLGSEYRISSGKGHNTSWCMATDTEKVIASFVGIVCS